LNYRFLIAFLLSLAASAQTVEFKLRNNYLVLTECSIADRHDLVGLIDTGATETAIDTKLVKQLHLHLMADKATFATRETAVSSVSIPELALGSLRFTSLSGIAIDMLRVESQLRVHADLIIGMDVLERSNVVIDYKAKTITFGAAPRFAHSSPLVRVGPLVLVPVVLGAKKMTLQLDTGLNGVLVYGAKVPALPRSLNSSNTTAIGGTTVQMTSLSLRIGDWEQRQATVAVTDDQPINDAPFDGLLGPVAIGVHRLALDWERDTMSWE
jgi:predicted aspartyl protease